MTHYFRFFPPVHELKKHAKYVAFVENGYRDDLLTKVLQTAIEKCKADKNAISGLEDADLPALFTENIFHQFEAELTQLYSVWPKRIINGTGVVLHTNLGRARLTTKMMAAIEQSACHYSSLEYDIETGTRGSRHHHIEHLLQVLTGTEAALVVNNNAAAVFMILSAFAKHSEVLVSRGELVEIGGSFRISSIMEESGAVLREVGTTNKTNQKDYEEALTSETAMIMKVHQSNFKIMGFTGKVSRESLIPIAKKNNVIYYEDLGSGALFDYRQKGIGEEPTLPEIIASGADLVSCSGDKLFGGPQAGIILGKKKWIDQLKKHQLARVLRVDKMTLAALTETLKAYLFTAEKAQNEIPTLRHLTESTESIHTKAQRLMYLAAEKNPNLNLEVVAVESKVGGGTMPEVALPSFAVKIGTGQLTAQAIADKLRSGSETIIGRVNKDCYYLDCRTISDKEMGLIAEQLRVL